MAQAEIVVRKREATGKGPVRRMRKTGWVPAVMYGHGKPAESLAVEGRLLERLLSAGARVVGVLYEDSKKGATRRALIREVQMEPVTQEVLHVDLQEIAEHERVVIKVPLVFRGEPAGIKEGGVLERMLHEVEIECPADAVVDRLTVDVSALALGDSLRVEDVPLPESATALTQGGLVAASVRKPREVEEEEVAAAGTEVPEQPEVIGEKEREERSKDGTMEAEA